MSAMFFSEEKRSKNSYVGFIRFVIGFAMLFIGVMYFRADVTTSAKFFDSIGMQPVMNYETFYEFIQFFIGHTTLSPESWAFGIGLSVLQLYFGYMIVVTVAGGNDIKSKLQAYLINPYVWLRVFTAIVDTYTDIDFRSYGMSSTSLVFKTLLISLFVYNLGSEYALTAGFRETVSNLDDMIRTSAQFVASFINAIRNFVGDLRAGTVTNRAFDAEDYGQHRKNQQQGRKF